MSRQKTAMHKSKKTKKNTAGKTKSRQRAEKRDGCKEVRLTEPAQKKGRPGKISNSLRGFKDIMPRDEKYWQKMTHAAESFALAYGYHWIETPILEEASLFVRSLGKGSDVVEKEMYIFEDKDGTRVALRPEATASVARAYISHGLHTVPQPVKVWYLGPMFRHDRPQAGRLRQFHQFSFESIGAHDPVVDAELILAAYNYLQELGIATDVHINSIGMAEDRERYVVELVGYLRSKRSYLCEDCRRRINKNPLRCLDCKNEECRPIIEEAPQIIDWLSDVSKKFFMSVLEYLDEADVPYVLQSTLVRGLDYYTDTVFEFYQADNTEQGAQSALGGGGRYDGLIEEIGGQPTPACGFSLGLERVLTVLRQKDETIPADDSVAKEPKIYLAQLGDQARRKCLGLLEQLRRNHIVVGHNLAKPSLKTQLELADKYRATHTLIIGQKELQDGTIIIRDMESGIQEIIDQKKVVLEIKKILSR